MIDKRAGIQKSLSTRILFYPYPKGRMMQFRFKILFAVLACLFIWQAGGANIVQTLECLDTNDGTMIFIQGSTNGINYGSSLYDVGDAWNWFDMYYFATRVYVSFPAAQVPENHALVSATLHCSVMQCFGNSGEGVYPIFNMTGGSTFSPNFLVSHVDYGATLETADYPTTILGQSLNFFNSYIPGWNALDVTDFVADDITQQRDFTQFQFMLQLLADWDNGDDYVEIYGADYAGHAPYLEVEFAPISSADDEVAAPITLISSPNPFHQFVRVDLKGLKNAPKEALIVNLRGQVVRKIGITGSVSGQNTLVWDGLDDSGRPAAPGIYFISLSEANPTATVKVVKLP
jgi:hypothetical protein